ncbi:MAG: hypothetical protein LKJ90_05790 [Faecalibacterium sp.]|nr:hypothetical protein [Faecalibacterium sp.]
MGLVRILLLLLPLIFAMMLYTRRSAFSCLPMLLLGIAGGGYLLSLFGAAGVGVWLLRATWLAAVAGILAFAVRRKKKFAPGISLLFVAAGLAFLWWIDRGRQFMIWDEFSHWGMAAKSLFSEGKLVNLVADSGDHFAEYPPALAPFAYLVCRAAGYGFREDLVLYAQSIFLLGMLWYPLHLCAQKKNPVVLIGGAGLLFLVPLICYQSSYTGILVDCLLGVLGAFVVLAAVCDGGLWDTLLTALGAFVLAGCVKSTGLVFAAAGCLLFAWQALRRAAPSAGDLDASRATANLSGAAAHKDGPHPAAIFSKVPPAQKVLAAFFPLFAAVLGKLSWQAFCAFYGITARAHGEGFSAAALGRLFSGEAGYRAQVVQKFFWNLFADFNYGTFLHFPYMLWFLLLGLAFWAAWRLSGRCTDGPRGAMARGFWLSWGFGLVFALGMLFSYLFLFAESEAVALASLSRYLNSPLTMLLSISVGFFCIALAQYDAKRQLAGIFAGLVLWTEAASPSSGALIKAIAAAPTEAAESVNFNRSYRMLADWIAASGDPEASRMYFVSQQDFGFAYIAMNYQLFPSTVPDQLSSVTIHTGADATYTYYETPQAWADMVADGYSYLCLHNIDDAFAADFACLFDDPAEIQNGNIFKVERQADGSVRFVPAATLAW